MKRLLPIPMSLELHGIAYRVHKLAELTVNTDNLGEAGYRLGEIKLQAVLPGTPMREDRQGQVFCHELTHVILHEMHDKKRDDEAFVDLFASLLHQALTSAEYTNDTGNAGSDKAASGRTRRGSASSGRGK